MVLHHFLAVLVHLGHVLGMIPMLLGALLAGSLVLGMTRMGINGRSDGLRRCRGGKGKR